MEDLNMKKISVEDKTQIKQLLYYGNVLGIKDDRYRSFGGFQLWWYIVLPRIALNSRRNVPCDCPRYWTRNPSRIIFPLPY